MLRVLESALAEDEEVARAALESLVSLVDHHPSFLRPFLEPAAGAMLTIVNHADFEPETRKLGMEFLVVLSEASGATVRKFPQLIDHIIGLALQFLSKASDDEAAWAAKEEQWGNFLGSGGEGEGEEDDEEDEDMANAAGSALDRLSRAIGGKAMWPLLQEKCGPLLRSADWKQRRAALLALSLAAEGCKRVLAPTIKGIVTAIVPFADDASLRVRHAAARCLGQLILDFSDPTAVEGDEGQTHGPLSMSSGAAAAGTGIAARSKAKTTVKSIQAAAADVLLPALQRLLSFADPKASRVRAVAAGALINFCDEEYCSEDTLDKYTAPLLQALFQVLRDEQSRSCKESAMTAIGCIASVVEEGFSQYYDIFCPLAKNIIATATGADNRALRGKAFECLSMICASVGKEKCGMDAVEVLRSILEAQRDNGSAATGGSGSALDAESFGYMSSSMARIAGLLREDFAPFLPLFLPPLLQMASEEISVVMMDGDDVNQAAAEKLKGKTVMDVDTKAVGLRKVAIDSHKLEEKITAVQTLASMVDDLGVDVSPFWTITMSIAEVFVPLVESHFGALRGLAVNTMRGLLLSCLADIGQPDKAQKFIEVALPTLAKVATEERDQENLFLTGECLSECLRVCWESVSDGAARTPPAIPYSLPASAMQWAAAGASTPHTQAVVPMPLVPQLLEALAACLGLAIRRREALVREFRKDAERDEEDEEMLEAYLEGENDFLTNMVDSVGYLIKMHRGAIVPHIATTVGPILIKYLNNKEPGAAQLRQYGIFLCDDLVEHASPEAHIILDAFLPAMADALTAESPVLRQAAVYGAGVCAIFGGPKFDAYVPGVKDTLIKIVTSPDSRDEENECATDNAVSSLLKIAMHRSACPGVDVNQIMVGVLAYLPIKGDGIEARLVHGWLVDGLAANDELWVGAGGSRLPLLLRVLAQGLTIHKANMEEAAAAAAEAAEEGEEDDEEDAEADSLFSEVTLTKLKTAFAGVKGSPAASAVATIVKGLKKKQQQILDEYGLVL
jgi:hypothetical protein